MSCKLQLEDSDYPLLLKEIQDPPRVLWVEGDPRVLSESCIAIVGARECSDYGEKVAFDLARELVKSGLVVVSGLAYGIDTAAHRGALAGGGKTIAVLGCGMDIPYPAENLGLKKKIAQAGVVVTEFAPGVKATSWSFPQRNRIISGLSRGVVVVEANQKSGSLITAELALQQGREVFAVPGSIHSPLSRGTNRLIQQGAKLVSGVADILDEIKVPVFSLEIKQPLLPDEEAIVNALSKGPCHFDELILLSGTPVDKMSVLLMEMEMGGKIRALPGSRFTLA